MDNNLPEKKDMQNFIAMMVDLGVLKNDVNALSGAFREMTVKLERQEGLKPKDLEDFKLYIKETILGVQSNLQKQIDNIDESKAEKSDVSHLVGILKWVLAVATALFVTMGSILLNMVFNPS